MSRNNILNVPSLEELSFKLSEQHLPSLSSKPLIPSVQYSLDYTNSRVSIVEDWIADPPVYPLSQRSHESELWRQSQLKSITQNATTRASFKQTPRTTLISKSYLKAKSAPKQSTGKHLAVKVFSFGKQKENRGKNSSLERQKSSSKEHHNPNWRLKSQSTHEQKRIKTADKDVLGLGNSLTVRKAHIVEDDVRHKKYMQKILQKRGVTQNMTHIKLGRLPTMLSTNQFLCF